MYDLEGKSREGVEDLQRDRDRWRKIALYLADCHAATAVEEGSLKSISKSRKNRYAKICRQSLKLLDGGTLMYDLTENNLRARLNRGIEICEQSS